MTAWFDLTAEQRTAKVVRQSDLRRRHALEVLLAPDIPRKQDCPTCVAMRDADRHGRWPVGDCSPWCKRRAARRKARSIG